MLKGNGNSNILEGFQIAFFTWKTFQRLLDMHLTRERKRNIARNACSGSIGSGLSDQASVKLIEHTDTWKILGSRIFPLSAPSTQVAVPFGPSWMILIAKSGLPRARFWYRSCAAHLWKFGYSLFFLIGLASAQTCRSISDKSSNLTRSSDALDLSWNATNQIPALRSVSQSVSTTRTPSSSAFLDVVPQLRINAEKRTSPLRRQVGLHVRPGYVLETGHPGASGPIPY